MEVTSIQIGDWFRYRYTIDNREIVRTFRISRIEDELKKYYVWGDGFGRMCYPEKLEPIPITSEILEKNGFIKVKDEETYGTTYYILIPTGYEANSYTIQITLYKEPICGVSVLLKIWGWIPPYNGGINDIHLSGAKYVHELQHALRLCGIDKEITI